MLAFATSAEHLLGCVDQPREGFHSMSGPECPQLKGYTAMRVFHSTEGYVPNYTDMNSGVTDATNVC